MIRKIIMLVVTSSAISAGLLYLGITWLGKYSPALAASENALVAGTNTQKSLNDIAAVDDVPLGNVPVALENVQNSPNPNQAVSTPPAKHQSGEKEKGSTPITGVTIAQLLKNPDQYLDKIFSITGIATGLSDEKFLLNDGTGQILVEKDDMGNFAILSGMSITVMGKLERTNHPSGFELDAYRLTDQNGKVAEDDDWEDDSDTDEDDSDTDDMDDSDMEDETSDKDTDEDSSDDDIDDSDSDDDLDDESDDDENNDDDSGDDKSDDD